MDHLHALVMAGGSGTRFWPASRKARPKQLLPIGPSGDESLLETTLRRIASLCPAERTLVVTGEHLLDATRNAVSAFAGVEIAGEPVPRNTAACIGWGTELIRRKDPEAIVMALPSDHHVRDESAFVREALCAAERISAPCRPHSQRIAYWIWSGHIRLSSLRPLTWDAALGPDRVTSRRVTGGVQGIAASMYSKSYECFPSAIVIAIFPESPASWPVPESGTTVTMSCGVPRVMVPLC